jgi:hypothetical protein
LKKPKKGKTENQQETTKVNQNFKNYRKTKSQKREKQQNSKEKKKRTRKKELNPQKNY